MKRTQPDIKKYFLSHLTWWDSDILANSMFGGSIVNALVARIAEGTVYLWSDAAMRK